MMMDGDVAVALTVGQRAHAAPARARVWVCDGSVRPRARAGCTQVRHCTPLMGILNTLDGGPRKRPHTANAQAVRTPYASSLLVVKHVVTFGASEVYITCL